MKNDFTAEEEVQMVKMTLDLIFQNLDRYLNGQELINLVRPELGY